MNSKTILTALICGILSAFLVSPIRAAEAKRHILLADHGKSGLVYTVDGKAPKKSDGLLPTLSRARAREPLRRCL